MSKILREDIPIYLPLHTIAAIEHREEKTPRRRIVVTSSLKVAKRTFVTELFTLSDFFEMAYFQRAKSSAKIISRVF